MSHTTPAPIDLGARPADPSPADPSPEVTSPEVTMGCGCGGCGCGGGQASRPVTAEGRAAEVAAGDLDLRGLPPQKRHALVSEAVGALLPGQAFVLANDHDPARLRGVLEDRHPGELTWEYLAAGPALWRVMIGRETCC